MKNFFRNPYVIGALFFIFMMFGAMYVAQQQSRMIVHEYNFEGMPLTVVVNFTDYRTIQEEFSKIHGSDGVGSVSAFATLYPKDEYCIIWTQPIRHQKDSQRIELLGHEFLHCIYGRWHPGNEDLYQ